MFSTILVIITLLVTLLQMAPLVLMESSPTSNAPLAILGILYPGFTLLNILLWIYWVLHSNKSALIPLIGLLSTLSILGGYLQLFPKKEVTPHQTLKVLSYNVRYMGTKNDQTYSDDIRHFIRSENPDIICMQEFDYGSESFQEVIELFKKETRTQHYIFTRYYPGKQNSERIILLSKNKIIHKGSLSDSHQRRYAIYADILHHTDTLRIINGHLQSIYLNRRDNPVLGDLRTPGGDLQRKGKRIYAKLTHAYKRRAVQSDSLVRFIEASPYKVVLCGDLNDTPSSYTYASIKRFLKDAFRQAGRGLGITFGKGILSFRIDYIFHDPRIKCSSYTIHKGVHFSDHYPVTATLELKEK